MCSISEFSVRLGDSSRSHSREYEITTNAGHVWNTNTDTTSDRAYTGARSDLLRVFNSRVSGRGHRIRAVCVSVRLSVHLSALSRLNRLTYDLDFWYES